MWKADDTCRRLRQRRRCRPLQALTATPVDVVRVTCGVSRSGAQGAGDVEHLLHDRAGIPLLEHVARRRPGRPWFAIGGIDHTNLDEVLTAGATRVVVVRAITEADDPATAAAALARRLHATHLAAT